MNILISPTAFKGTLSPWEAARTLEPIFHRHFPQARIALLPLADGGDGTLEVLMKAMHGRLIKTKVMGPLGKRHRATWALCPNKTAVLEMARASGLALVKGKNKILAATSFGTGELIKAALDRGCRRIYIGVGGTATADGGAGALRALGMRLLDIQGRDLDGSPRQLIHLRKIDWRGLDPRLEKTRIDVLCDVTNPLLGARGSARTFGPQKGASPQQIVFLERVMKKWSRFAKVPAQNRPGAGAAGAVAFGLSGFLGANLRPGTPFIMNALRWQKQAARARLIVTGEGRLDKTSFSGKVIGAIARLRRRAKVLAVCGDSPLGGVYLQNHGISHVECLGPQGLREPRKALQIAAKRLCASFSSSRPARKR